MPESSSRNSVWLAARALLVKAALTPFFIILSACPVPEEAVNASDLLIRACLNMMACDHIYSVSMCLINSNAEHILHYSSQRARIDCLAAAKNCDELDACRVHLYSCPPDPSGKPTCDLGLKCMTGASGEAWCGTGTCDDFPSRRRCEGDIEVSCDDGVEVRRDCKALAPGVQCVDGNGCSGTGPFCRYSRCEEGKVVHCLALQETEAIDCYSPHMPLTCPKDRARCVPDPDMECDPMTFFGLCNGDRLAFCDGNIRQLSCKEWGYGGCSVVKGDWHGRCHW